MIDHVNFQVPDYEVHTEDMTKFWAMFGFVEVEPNEALDDQYTVRWWRDPGTNVRVHVVGGLFAVDLGLGHLCIVTRSEDTWAACLASPWLERHNPDSPMRRLWLRGPGAMRVEVQRA